VKAAGKRSRFSACSPPLANQSTPFVGECVSPGGARHDGSIIARVARTILVRFGRRDYDASLDVAWQEASTWPNVRRVSAAERRVLHEVRAALTRT
jgi:hypothetical protein